MSSSNPNPEERRRMVDAALGALKVSKPEWFEGQPEELDILAKRLNDITERVAGLVKPIYDAALDNGEVSSQEGRKKLLKTIHKFYLDEFVHLGKDELIFSLAFLYAQVMRDQLV